MVNDGVPAAPGGEGVILRVGRHLAPTDGVALGLS